MRRRVRKAGVIKMTLHWVGTYKLTSANVDSYAPKEPGVYRISTKQTDGGLRVVYVGQTEDLCKRMGQYVNKDTDNECLLNHLGNHICYFRVAEVANSDDRDAAERALFEYFDHPECNDPDKIPDVGPLEINFN